MFAWVARLGCYRFYLCLFNLVGVSCFVFSVIFEVHIMYAKMRLTFILVF